MDKADSKDVCKGCKKDYNLTNRVMLSWPGCECYNRWKEWFKMTNFM